MKISLPFLILIVFLFSFALTSQNLVPDSGFEIMQKSPSKDDNGIRCTSNWINAVLTGGDYYNSVANSKLVGVGAPRNIFGYQQPHSGNGYAGICIQKDMVEYVETKLTSPLKKGQKYLIEFYICRAEHRLQHVDEFGVLFTTKIQWGAEKTGITIKPPIDFVNPNGYKDTKNWTKLASTYTAEGFEAVIILGHFNYDKKISMKGKAHYYIDDVTIVPVYEDTTPSNNNEEIPVSTSQLNDSIKQIFAPIMEKNVTLKNIFFNSNKSELLPNSFEELNKLANYLLKSKNTFIVIKGHTDNTGIEDENKKLSEARAKAVAEYLNTRGINEDRIKYFGYGSLKPIATNEADDGRQQNRRVEFVINKN
jgi:OOP family OmpA-OmpF porin